MTSFYELYDIGRNKLQSVPDGEADARRLLMSVFDIELSDLLSGYTEKFDDPERVDLYNRYIEKRKARMPLQYILNEQYFCGLRFYVDENVLIPRQDTESLVEYVLEHADGGRVLDMCTGSGCIAIALAKLGHFSEIYGADISRPALEIADRNAGDNEVNILFYESDMFSELDELTDLDLIVSNPPYIPTKIIGGLMDEVKDHEPELALDGDEDGLKFYRILAAESKKHLKKEGKLIMEIGFDQADDVTKLLSEEGYKDIKIVKDISGLNRVIAAHV